MKTYSIISASPLYAIILIITFVAASACGSDGNDTNNTPEDFQNLSQEQAWKLRTTGTANTNSAKDLSVRIKIKADNQTDNAQKPEDFKTKFDVIILRDGESVTNADVTVHAYKGPSTKLRFDPDDDPDDDDEYEGRIDGYFRAYQVDIVVDNDRIEGIQFAGPALHYFTAPTHGQTLPADQDLEVTWKLDGQPADEAWIDGEGFSEIKIDDNGHYTIPADKLHDDDDDEIELKRLNRMKLPDLSNDSEITITIENEVEISLE